MELLQLRKLNNYAWRFHIKAGDTYSRFCSLDMNPALCCFSNANDSSAYQEIHCGSPFSLAFPHTLQGDLLLLDHLVQSHKFPYMFIC